MNEEIIISGKNNPLINPELSIWEWHISVYLFLGGMAAGLLFFSAVMYLTGKKNDYPVAVRDAAIFAPILIFIGLIMLFLDLKHKLYFWQLYTTFNIDSPMSWGAWVLLIITPLSILWWLSLQSEFPDWIWNRKPFQRTILIFRKYRTVVAIYMVFLSLVLGVYTGILLSAFNARPLWNSSVLGFLFLVSGLSTAAVFIVWRTKKETEKSVFRKIDIGLILVEMLLITHFFMALASGPEAQVQAADLFLGGQFTFSFWFFVVIVGLIVPGFLEFLEMRGKRIPVYVAPLLVLLGGLIFRFIMVHAGQVSSFS